MSGPDKPANEGKPPPLKVILMVEQDNHFGELCKGIIQHETSHHVLLAKDDEIAWKMLHHIQADLLLLTHKPPEAHGLKIYDRLHALVKIPTILIDGKPSVELRQIAKRGLTLIKQPLVMSALIAAIEQLLTEPSEVVYLHDPDSIMPMHTSM